MLEPNLVSERGQSVLGPRNAELSSFPERVKAKDGDGMKSKTATLVATSALQPWLWA